MDELKKVILDSVDETSIPNLSNSIKAIYKHKMSKRVPWYRNKLTYGIGVPALAGVACLAIILPLTVRQNDSGSLIPIINQELANTETAYGISTLSIANAISFNANLFKNVSNGVAPNALQIKKANADYNGGWGGWTGWTYINENDLREILQYAHPYLYVADKMLNNNLKVSPDVFKHTSGKDFEEYECIFNKDQDFECSFDFKEKLNDNKNKVIVNGELGVYNDKFTVEGIRNNIQKDENAEMNLNVKFSEKPWWEGHKCPSLSFSEKTDENNNNCYQFVYSEKNQTVYDIKLTNQYYDDGFGTKFPWVQMEVIKYKEIFTPYFPGGGYYLQPQSYVFSLERGNDGESLNLYLFGYGQKLFINVIDNDGAYFYYLWEYNPYDPFGNFSKH